MQHEPLNSSPHVIEVIIHPLCLVEGELHFLHLFPHSHGLCGELLKLLVPFIFHLVLFVPFFLFLPIIIDFHMWRLLELRFLKPSKTSYHFFKGLSMYVQSLKDLLYRWVFYGGSLCFLGGLLPLLGVWPQSWSSAFLSLESKWEWGRVFLSLMVQWCLKRSPIFIKFMSQLKFPFKL